jgi:hypothetical protein
MPFSKIQNVFHELNHLGFIKNVIKLNPVSSEATRVSTSHDLGTKSWLVDPFIFGASVTSPFLCGDTFEHPQTTHTISEGPSNVNTWMQACVFVNNA